MSGKEKCEREMRRENRECQTGDVRTSQTTQYQRVPTYPKRCHPGGGTRNPELEINGSQADVPETRHCQGGSGGYGSSDRVLIEPPEMACYGGSSNSHFIPLALMLNNSEVHPDLTLMLQ